MEGGKSHPTDSLHKNPVNNGGQKMGGQDS
jgi:hypothetical protein